MSDRVALKRTATAGRLAIAALTAAFLGGCSADALRMESFSNPLAGVSNPFSGLMGGDTTGSIETPAARRLPRAAAASASTFNAPAAPAGGLAKYAPPVGGPVQGWSTAGGSSIVMANGESLSVLSQRYGVPEQAILKANGLSSASDLGPGSRLTIPVFNAGGASSAARAVAAAPAKFTPPAAAPARVSAVGRVAEEAKTARERLDDERAKLAAARKEAAQAKAELESERRKAALETRRAESASIAAQTKDAKAEKALAEAKRAELKARQERLARLKADEAATERKVAAAKAEVKKQAKVEAKIRDDEAKQEKLAAAREKTARATQAKADADRKIAEARAAEAKAIAARKAAEKAAEKGGDRKGDKSKKVAEADADREAKLAEAKAAKEAKLAEAKAAAEQKAADRKLAEAKAAEAKAARSAKVEEKADSETRVAKADLAKPEAAKSEPTTTASVKTDDKPTTAANGNPEFRWPARGRVIQGFRSNGNDGINIALPEGTAVKAAESGVVAYAGSELKNLGNLVLIRHPNGYVSAYAHNGDIEVKRGDQVKRGQTIAKSGQSGAVQSPQLHFELRKGSTPVDPSQYLAGL